jgi:hypothetical protein
VLLAGALLTACGTDEPPGLERAVLDFVAASQREDGGSYEPPGRDERRDVSDGVLALADGEPDRARRLVEPHGYRLSAADGVDLVVPEQVPDRRGWGLYAVRSAGRDVAVEVPHPRADLRTEHLGAALAEAVSARHLLVAGARRDRDGGRADVAHERESLFAVVHEQLAARGVPAVQVHGYAADSSPGNDVVVSPGAAELSPLVREVADRLDDAGLRTCRVWREHCGQLEGRRNVQGAASELAGTPFLHLEVSSGVREDRRRRAVLVDAVADAVRATVPRG